MSKTVQEQIDQYLDQNEDMILSIKKDIAKHRHQPEDCPEDYGVIFEGMTIPRYKPWMKDKNEYRSALGKEKLFNIRQFSSLAPEGVAYECGVFTGGTTRMLLDLGWDVVAFDTFKGIAGAGEEDIFEDGAYNGGEVFDYIEGAEIEQGILPDSIINRLETRAGKGYPQDNVTFAHIDLDVYKPTLECLRIIYEIMQPGGIIVVDDYGIWPTPGVKQAVDEFYAPRSFYVNTGQWVIIR